MRSCGAPAPETAGATALDLTGVGSGSTSLEVMRCSDGATATAIVPRLFQEPHFSMQRLMTQATCAVQEQVDHPADPAVLSCQSF